MPDDSILTMLPTFWAAAAETPAASSASWVTFWAATAATMSGLGSAFTAWINWNNRIDPVRPELLITDCSVGPDWRFTIKNVRNVGAGAAIYVKTLINSYTVVNGRSRRLDIQFGSSFEYIPEKENRPAENLLPLYSVVAEHTEFLFRRRWFRPFKRQRAKKKYFDKIHMALQNAPVVFVVLSIEYYDIRGYFHRQTHLIALSGNDYKAFNMRGVGKNVYITLHHHKRFTKIGNALRRHRLRLQHTPD